MLQLDNQSPFAAQLYPLQDVAGVDTIYLVVKGTFTVGEEGVRIAEEQLPSEPVDVHWDDPATSSIRYPGEAHPPKPATDVLLVGAAYAPDGRPAERMGVSFTLGKLRKAVQVVGDRVWVGGKPSEPVPAVSVPLRWERAYGGKQVVDGKVLSEPRNPIGCGFRGERAARELEGTPVPNLEAPGRPITSLRDAPAPVGTGAIAPSWSPRSDHAGTYDERWRKARAPYLPADFDPRFLQAAPPDQVYPGYVQGGEPVVVLGASPEVGQRFTLPRCELEVAAHLAAAVVRPELRIETVLLEPDHRRFTLVWRGAIPCDKKLLKLKVAQIRLARIDGVER